MVKDKNLSVIIAGAGDSKRLGQNISKQFVLLNEKPLLFYSLEKFIQLGNVIEIIIVTNDLEETKSHLLSFPPEARLAGGGTSHLKQINLKVAQGGKLRQDSVYNGFLDVNPRSDFVLVHDVARPLFDLSDTKKCIEVASMSGAAILAVPLVDTVKKGKLDKGSLVIEGTLNRESLYLVQTPQVFSYGLLSDAYKWYRDISGKHFVFTDEAALIEFFGKPVNLVIGNRENIKITYPEDLEIANSILKNCVHKEGIFIH